MSRRGLTHTLIGQIRVFPRTCRPPGSLAVRFASPVHVTQEGPDILSRYCPVQACGRGKPPIHGRTRRAGMEVGQEVVLHPVVGGVDTHKDLHVAAVVDELDRVLGTRCFATTRQGYRQMLAWMRSFGQLRCVGIEATGTYGAGLLRSMQNAGVDVLEVTAPVARQSKPRALRQSELPSTLGCLLRWRAS